MLRIFCSILLVLIFSQRVFGSETIYAEEVESYLYSNGKMKHSEGQFQITYLIEENKITRIRVYDINKKAIIPDNTTYYVYKQLSSDPNISTPATKRIIRAIGQPGSDAVELLVIEVDGNFVQSVKSTADYFVISRLRLIN